MSYLWRLSEIRGRKFKFFFDLTAIAENSRIRICIRNLSSKDPDPYQISRMRDSGSFCVFCPSFCGDLWVLSLPARNSFTRYRYVFLAGRIFVFVFPCIPPPHPPEQRNFFLILLVFCHWRWKNISVLFFHFAYYFRIFTKFCVKFLKENWLANQCFGSVGNSFDLDSDPSF